MDTYTLTTRVTLGDALALCTAITVPCATPGVPIVPVAPTVAAAAAAPQPEPAPTAPAPTSTPTTPAAPATPAPPPRRSQRLLAKLRALAATPAALAPNNRSSRTRKCPRRLCKGRQKATTAPIQIRLRITSKAQCRDSNVVGRVHVGFRYLGQSKRGAGRTALLLTLGADIKSRELAGLDRMEVDIRLGSAKT